MRDHNKSIEKEFYKLSGIKYIENYKKRKTFDIASKFEILIGHSSSTLTYEMLAREKKIIVLNRDYNHYPFITKKFGYFNNLKNEGPFWIISGNEYKFIKLFDKIKNMPKKKWHHLLREYKEDTCEFNYLNKKLKNHIKNII